MPIDYSKYPENWKTEIRPTIMQRAQNCCEFCGLEHLEIIQRSKSNGAIVRRLEKDGTKESLAKLIYEWEVLGTLSDFDKPIKVVLTVAHLDADLSNNEHSNLRALCQRCHLNWDRWDHKLKGRKKLESIPKDGKADFSDRAKFIQNYLHRWKVTSVQTKEVLDFLKQVPEGKEKDFEKACDDIQNSLSEAGLMQCNGLTLVAKALLAVEAGVTANHDPNKNPDGTYKSYKEIINE